MFTRPGDGDEMTVLSEADGASSAGLLDRVFQEGLHVVTLSPLPEVQSRTEAVAAILRRSIISGDLRPGDTLVDRRIAEDLGVSKTPVREALLLLQHTGLVTSSTTRRLSVASLSEADVRHIYQERSLLEPWALRHTVIGDAAVESARSALDRATRERRAGNGAAAALANRDFHRALYSHCPNPYIVKSLDGLQDLTALATASVIWEAQDRAEIDHVGHEEIFEAAVGGCLDEAARLLKTHISSWIADE